MTIKQLLERVLPGARYDRVFARRFRSLMKKVCKDRDDLNDAGPYDTKAAEKFLGSWMQVLDLFADDPRSLAALTAPKVKIRGKLACPTTLNDLFTKTVVQTHTVYLFLYESAAEQAESKPKPATSKSKTASKKVKASKRK